MVLRTNFQLNAIKALLCIAGFEVVEVKKGEMKCEHEATVINTVSNLIVTVYDSGIVYDDDISTQWLNDLISFTLKEVGNLTLSNLERIVDEVMGKLNLATPLKPIPLSAEMEMPDVLLELPVSKNPELQYPWFVKHTLDSDEVPKRGEHVGIHGPRCLGIIKRAEKSPGSSKHKLVCRKCKYKVEIPKFGLTYAELRIGIQKHFAVEGKVFNPNMARRGPRLHMRKKQ